MTISTANRTPKNGLRRNNSLIAALLVPNLQISSV
jgi:hypothetical protein